MEKRLKLAKDVLSKNGEGTTIKVASYEDLNKEFNRIQGCRLFGENNIFSTDEATMINDFTKIQKIAQELRESFFDVLIERRYLIQGRNVLKETCDKILKDISLSNKEKDIINMLDNTVGPMFLRSIVYKIAYKKAIESLEKIKELSHLKDKIEPLLENFEKELYEIDYKVWEEI